MNDILDTVAQWLDQGKPVALATVTKTWGSAPRPTGSQMAVSADGSFAGSVSGGCVESAVIMEAQSAINSGQSKKLAFGVSNETAWSLGLPCGGQIEIFVEPAVNRQTLAAIQAASEDGKPMVRAVNLTSGADTLLDPYTDKSPLGPTAAQAARHDASNVVMIEGEDWFLTVYNPPLDLVIVGAVHIAQSLAQMALMAGYRVRVIDPRSGFANSARFTNVSLVTEWPEEAFAQHPMGPRSALVVLAHDPKIDDPALIAALKSPCFYIGALGSKKNQAARLARLKEDGFDDATLDRIRGPVGLAIGAKNPVEIAVAILAEITLILRG